ncbi:N-acetyltransferase 10 [Hypoxylon texense]
MDAASSWLDRHRERAQVDTESIRTYCLLLLAQQVGKFKTISLKPSAGSALEMATQMDLRVDSETSPSVHIPTDDQDARRRLWAAVLELNVQESMNSGYAPAFASNDLDTGDSLSTAIKPWGESTQNLFQFLLMKTMPVRWRIARYINSQYDQRSLDEGMSLSQELMATLHECHKYIESSRMSCTPPTGFQTKCFDLLSHRFLFALHQPFAVQATRNPSLYYSRKVCRNTSLLLLSTLSDSGDDDFRRLCLSGPGTFSDVLRKSALYICDELTYGLQTDLPLSRNPASMLVQKEMQKAVAKYLDLTLLRIEGGNTGTKCHILVSCLLAYVDALQAEASVQERVSMALETSLGDCYTRLKSLDFVQAGNHTSTQHVSKSVGDQHEYWQWDSLIYH